ncbi:MAG: hypothetical protein O2943_00165 [Actinomycetota bacterium]|nr:hypothetical protein [Actinomycetota bacterium]
MALLTKQHQGQLSAQVPAQRMRVVRWRDLRLWIGLVIILLAMFAGAFLLSRGEQTTTVWRASSDLSVGAIPVATPVTVSLGAAQDQYLLASEPLTGQLRWPVAAGDLIPRGALGFSPMLNARLVTLPVDPLHAPVHMATGDVVDIWSTPADLAGGVTAQPVLVLASVTVAEVAADAVGVGGEIAVVVEIPAAAADQLVAAARSGLIDLVAVPIASQQVS